MIWPRGSLIGEVSDTSVGCPVFVCDALSRKEPLFSSGHPCPGDLLGTSANHSSLKAQLAPQIERKRSHLRVANMYKILATSRENDVNLTQSFETKLTGEITFKKQQN